MPKIFIRSIYCNGEVEQQRLRDKLNELGFFVLYGIDCSLDVYVLEDRHYIERVIFG